MSRVTCPACVVGVGIYLGRCFCSDQACLQGVFGTLTLLKEIDDWLYTARGAHPILVRQQCIFAAQR